MQDRLEVALLNENCSRSLLLELMSRVQEYRGYHLDLARALNVHPTLFSKIVNGKIVMTAEQGCLVAEFFHLNEMEKLIFVQIILVERAGNPTLKKLLASALQLHRENYRVYSLK